MHCVLCANVYIKSNHIAFETDIGRLLKNTLEFSLNIRVQECIFGWRSYCPKRTVCFMKKKLYSQIVYNKITTKA